MYEWFAQDSWKATSKLRLEFGLRFSRIQPYYSLWRNMLVFDPASYDASKAVPVDPRTGFAVVTNPIRIQRHDHPGRWLADAAKGRIPIADSGEFDSLFKGSKEYSQIHNVWSRRSSVDPPAAARRLPRRTAWFIEPGRAGLGRVTGFPLNSDRPGPRLSRIPKPGPGTHSRARDHAGNDARSWLYWPQRSARPT